MSLCVCSSAPVIDDYNLLVLLQRAVVFWALVTFVVQLTSM